MKILYICDWDVTYTYEKLSSCVESSYDSQIESHALVVGKIYQSYLSRQNHCFRSVTLLQDYLENFRHVEVTEEKLKSIEEKYGTPTLWPFVCADRTWCWDHIDDLKKKIAGCFEFYEQYLNKHKINVIVCHGFSSMPHYVMYAVAKKLNIKIVTVTSARIDGLNILNGSPLENFSDIFDDIDQHDISDNVREDVACYLSKFRKERVVPDYVSLGKKQRQLSFSAVYNIIIRFIQYSYNYYIRNVFSNDHTKKSPFIRILHETKNHLNKFFHRRLISWDNYDPSQLYVYFPLHVEPEASTMVMGPYYMNQISIIENVAKSLPINKLLFVKEHGSMLGLRKLSYYKSIAKIPNVRLISPSVDSHDIIKNSDLVVTITGTAGLEALFYKKPVITLGSIYYNYCPLVKKMGDIAPAGWADVIFHMLNNYQHNEEVFIAFLEKVFSVSFKGIYYESSLDKDAILADKNIQAFADQIIDYINFNKSDDSVLNPLETVS